MKGVLGAVTLSVGWLVAVGVGLAHAGDGANLRRPASTYLLGCGGCHGLGGVSNSRLVPDLHEQVGYFLSTRAGREYLVRIPNVAFYAASDQELTDMLNYMVFELGGSSVPPGARRYSLGEVAALRKRPLNEVSLTTYRTELVDDLISQHHAPVSLRIYGSDGYRASTTP